MRKVGLYSGTFDPIHKGHIAFALEALKQSKLDEVVFLPEGSPRAKVKVSPLTIRKAQIDKALTSHPSLTAATLTSDSFSYARTMPEIKEKYPNATYTLLMGSDVAKSLAYGWEDADKLFAECTVVIGLRRDDTQESISDHLKPIQHKLKIDIHFCSPAYPFESSTQYRDISRKKSLL